MRSNRAEDFPGNMTTFTFSVPPAAEVFSDWIDLSGPSVAEFRALVEGLDFGAGETLDVTVHGALGYYDPTEPDYTPNTEDTSRSFPVNQQGDAADPERLALLVLPRWCYILLTTPGTSNTNTAEVTVTLVS
jgi:hypothetical protein